MSQDDQDQQNDPGQLRAKFEEQGAELAQLRAQNQQLVTQGLFRDAGLDLQNKQHAAFMRAYDGDTSAEAVKAYVDDLGIQQQPPPPPAVEVQQVPETEQAALQRMAMASMGGKQPPPPSPSAEDEAWQKIQSLGRHASKEQVDAAFVDLVHARGGKTTTVTGDQIIAADNFNAQNRHPFR